MDPGHGIRVRALFVAVEGEGRRIVATRMEGVATTDTLHAEPTAARGAEALDASGRVA